MNRRKSFRRSLGSEETGPNISPLIDVAFLLIIYFLVTATLLPREADLGVELPSGLTGSTEIEPLVIQIHEDNRIGLGPVIIEQAPVDMQSQAARKLPALRAAVKDQQGLLRSFQREALIIVKADDKANHQRFTDVLDTLASLKITRVSFESYEDEKG